ncbi:helix-turn-helix transcriptional regulator [Pseudomonas sp. FP2196]|uniref:helix-turn-helix domain-containing protein n=1 Tax=Pseudomonas sp. FP2196 TaxID=2954086 RepID=UPI002735D2A3|nr:helix-turn-helix transcriptional regulator [Pseudomonas sp. FP2196]WLH36234.1 helix-turn-helix transcriptional regulator [Pseudomonas sp. FP2196]
MCEFLPANLRLLCSHYRSVAEVCRKIRINRGQFNKYLCGKSVPTPFNLKRICDFFGVEEFEIGLPSEQFIALIGVKANKSHASGEVAASRIMHEHLREQSSPELKAHIGYYYEYYHAMTEPGSILCSLVQVREEGDDVVYERNERLQIAGAAGDFERYRYLGIAYYLRDRLFFVDYESITSNEISQTILIPSFKSCITRLNGLKMGVSAADHRAPSCSRVVWEYLGQEIDRVDAYRRVRLYKPDDCAIDDDLRARLAQARIVDGLFVIA